MDCLRDAEGGAKDFLRMADTDAAGEPIDGAGDALASRRATGVPISGVPANGVPPSGVPKPL